MEGLELTIVDNSNYYIIFDGSKKFGWFTFYELLGRNIDFSIKTQTGTGISLYYRQRDGS